MRVVYGQFKGHEDQVKHREGRLGLVGPYMTARVRVEPMTFGRKALTLPMSHHAPV